MDSRNYYYDCYNFYNQYYSRPPSGYQTPQNMPVAPNDRPMPLANTSATPNSANTSYSFNSWCPPTYSTNNSWYDGGYQAKNESNNTQGKKWPYPDINTGQQNKKVFIKSQEGNNGGNFSGRNMQRGSGFNGPLTSKEKKKMQKNKHAKKVQRKMIEFQYLSPEEQRKVEEKERIENQAKTAFLEFKESLPLCLTKLFISKKCKICAILLNSYSMAVSHYEGKSHRKMLEKILAGETIVGLNNQRIFLTKPEQKEYFYNLKRNKHKKFKPIQCYICQVTLTSRMQSIEHFHGKTHTKKAIAVHTGKIDPNTLKNPVKPKDNSVFKEWKKSFDEYCKLSEEAVNQFYCEICKVHTLTAEGLAKHKEDPKHIRLANAPAGSDTTDTSRVEPFKQPNGSYYCNFCEFSSDDVPLFENHLDSVLHKCQSKKKPE